MLSFAHSFFFFQAEDGIRDYKVTGVQTCALPILFLIVMQRLLCTIGFTGKTAEQFFDLLLGAGVEQVIDIRQNRLGQLSGFAKHPDLSFFLQKIGKIAYAHEPQLAPPPELLKSYRMTKDWPAYEASFLAIDRNSVV